MRPIPVDFIRYAPEEFGRIQGGWFAKDMDDKWALVWTGGRLDVCRSWSGEAVWRCFFEPGPDGVRLREVQVVDEGMARHELADVAGPWFLIGWRILGTLSWDDVPPAESEGEGAAGIFSGWVRLMRARIPGLPAVPRTPPEQASYFEGLAARFPESLSVAWTLAALYRELGRHDAADAALRRLSGDGSDRSYRALWAWTERAWLYGERGDLPRAGTCLMSALTGASDGAGRRDVLMLMRKRLGLKARAGADVLDVLAREDLDWLGTADLSSAQARGLVRLCVGDWERAETAFDEMILEDAEDGAPFKYRALSRYLRGDWEGARADAELAAATLPLDPLVRRLLDVTRPGRSGPAS